VARDGNPSRGRDLGKGRSRGKAELTEPRSAAIELAVQEQCRGQGRVCRRLQQALSAHIAVLGVRSGAADRAGMPILTFAAVRRHALPILSIVFCASLAACGGGEEPEADDADASAALAEPLAAQRDARTRPPAPDATSGNTLELGTTIPGFPHKIDVYRPAGATRAIVFLHGNGGSTGALAYTLGFSRSGVPSDRSVNWEWLSQNGVIAVLPQGQAAPGSTVRTWSNYIFKSGQNDVAFLSALSSSVKSKYGMADVSLAGYSAGGMMSARVWCEAGSAYKAFVSVAGPMMSGTGTGVTCTPPAPAPYFVLLGAKDTVLPGYNPGLAPPTAAQAAAGLTSGFLVAEWTRHGDRGRALCGETTQLSGASTSASGATWNNCDARIRYTVVNNADHSIPSFEAATGAKLVDTIAGFVN
jgi:polyhydroxybutyrate depolymerase